MSPMAISWSPPPTPAPLPTPAPSYPPPLHASPHLQRGSFFVRGLAGDVIFSFNEFFTFTKVVLSPP